MKDIPSIGMERGATTRRTGRARSLSVRAWAFAVVAGAAAPSAYAQPVPPAPPQSPLPPPAPSSPQPPPPSVQPPPPQPPAQPLPPPEAQPLPQPMPAPPTYSAPGMPYPADAAPGAVVSPPPSAPQIVPAPNESTVAPPGMPIAMPPNYLDEPGRWARRMPYEEGMLIPTGYHVGTRPIRALWIAGLSVFGAFYASTLAAGIIVANGRQDAGWLLIPIAGPVAYGAASTEFDKGSLLAAMTFTTLAQATGVALFIGGLAAHERALVRNDIAGVDSERGPVLRVGPGSVSLAVPF